MDYFAKIVEPMHDKYIQNTKANADLVINNEYSPKVEAQKSGLHEVQLKFKATHLTEEKLRKLGAERLAVVVQNNHYYNRTNNYS